MTTQATLIEIEAEFTRIGFLLEALWANVALNHGATPAEIDALGAALLRQFQALPAHSSPSALPAPANDTLVRDLAAQRIGDFFENLRARIATVRPA